MITGIVYMVTFRTDSKAPQQELKRYTKIAAEEFAKGIIAMGGVAIVTEDVEDIPEREDEVQNPRGLIWND